MRNMTEDSGYSCGRGASKWPQPPNSVFCFKLGGGFMVVSLYILNFYPTTSPSKHYSIVEITNTWWKHHAKPAYIHSLDTLVNPQKCASRPEETEKEHADRCKRPEDLPLIKVDSVCLSVVFYDLHWCHMIFVSQISHTHTVLWCWQGLLFLIHRTEKLLSDETRHQQHPLQNSSTWETCHQLPTKSSAMYTLPPPCLPPTTNIPSHSDREFWTSLACRFWSRQQLNNRLLHILHQEPHLL